MLSNYAMFQTNKGKILAPQLKQNIEGVNVYFDHQKIAIQKKMHSYIGADKLSKQYILIPKEQKVADRLQLDKMTKRVFSAFLGIVSIKGYKFVVLCDEAKIAANVEQLMIYEISSLYFLSYLSDRELSLKPQKKIIFDQIRQLYEILRYGFYFSYKHNLTQSFQHQQMGVKNRFTWNKRFLIELDKYKILKQWCLPVIQGYVNSFEVFVQGTKITYILISRRSNRKAGTRYFDRGVDQDGYVANFVHTEQIIKIDDFFISDGQIRGSVPVFFEQKGLRTLVKLTRGFELTHQIYEKHLQRLKDSYRRVFIANLLCKGKNGQKIIIRQFQKHIKQKSLDKNVKYLYFDFHKAVQNNNSDGDYSKVDSAIEKVRQMKRNLGYFVLNTAKNQVLDEPEGIFRTNCLDCLDRTNFFQAKLALISLQDVFARFNITTQNLLEVMNSGTEENDLIRKFRNIWADNGDMISYHYTGTGSTHTDITRDGKRGLTGEFKHKYKSISRFYNQNFWDFHKMNLIEVLLGEKISQGQNVKIPEMIKSKEMEFTKKHLIDIYIFSWKVPQKPPKSLTLFPTTPDIIVVSLQQVKQSETWSQLVKQALDEKYVLMGEKMSNNNLLKIFIKNDQLKYVSNVQLTKVKFKSYFNQYMSTKCAVIIRFTYCSSKIVVCGCQLEYGREFATNRIRNLRDVHEYAFQEVKVGEKKLNNILNDDVIFLIGNMNTHVSPQYKDQITRFKPRDSSSPKLRIQQNRSIRSMIDSDQFSTQIKQSLLEYREYEQEEVLFLPTYRFNGSCFEGQISGWPDRIWFSSHNKIICSQYGVVQELRQSHVPVVGSYQLQIDQIDEGLRSAVLEEIMRRVSKVENMEMEEFERLQDENTEVVEIEKTPLVYSQTSISPPSDSNNNQQLQLF